MSSINPNRPIVPCTPVHCLYVCVVPARPQVGLAVFGREVRVEAQVGRFRGDVKGLLAAVDGMQPVGGPTRAGQALRHVTGHGFLSAPVFADVTDDLPRVVVLLTTTPSADEVLEPARYARDRETFLIGVGPERLRGQLDNVTGNPQRTLTYSGAGGLGGKIPELTAKICSVDNQGEAPGLWGHCSTML